jgi:hypothetical protein
MKKQPYNILIISVLSALVFNSAQAQSYRSIKAKVLFNFVIKDRTLPAGEYVFSVVRLGGSDAVKIQAADGHITAFVPALPARAEARQSEPGLQFSRYGDQYFLAQVCGIEETRIQQLVKSRAEDRLAKARGAKENISVVAHKQ